VPPPSDAAQRRGKPPVLAYSVETLPPVDLALFEAARGSLTKLSEVIVHSVCGKGIFSPVSVDEPQVGDLNLWNAADLTERFFSGSVLQYRRPALEHAAAPAPAGHDHC
jgi:uncharacterized protein YcgI (DUF1989 family)